MAIPRSVRFFRQSEAALLAAIELYNKPDFRYREESFAILALNAWELLLKAKLLAESSNRSQCLYFYEKRQTKKKTPSKKLYLRKNAQEMCKLSASGKSSLISKEKRAFVFLPR